LHPNAKSELSKYCKKVHIIKLSKFGIFLNLIKAFFSTKPLQIGYFYSASAHAQIKSIIAKAKPNHLYGQLVRVAEYMRHVTIPTTLDYQDALSAGLLRRKEKSKGLKRFVFDMEYRRLAKYESEIMEDFTNTTIITEQDRELIQHTENQKITIVPNGVDMEFFHPMEMEKTYDVVFTGNMNYPPNVMAAKFLVNEVLPLIKRQKQDAKLLIAGASPHTSVRALASESVTVSGWLDDIRTAYASSKVFVAPMQIGTGLQNKLLEAMAMKIPSVTSDLANAALRANTQSEIKVAAAQDKEAFAQHILDLLTNESAAQQQAKAAHQFVLNNYSWKSSVDILENLF
jgi:glycosyltransferase involved in cell wall biosynthesis